MRTPLQPFDSRNGEFTGRVGEHPALGELDYVHIPLLILREYFHEEFEAVSNYWSFAVMRDPFERFASSVSQRLKMYSEQPIRNRSLKEVQKVIDECIDYLSRQPREQHLLPPEYIHFQKQTDYIELDGKRLPHMLYTVDETDRLLADVGRRVRQKLSESTAVDGMMQANHSVVFRNDLLRRVIRPVRPITNRVSRLLPETAKQIVRDRVYVPRDQRMRSLFSADHVQSFIRDYYEDDIALYQEVSYCERGEA